MLKTAIKLILVAVFIGQSAPSFAHKYFFGLTDLTLNPKTQQLEIIHQLTAHDLENALAEISQEHFSPAHPDYETYIKNYVSKHFKLSYHQSEIKISWVGLELVKDKIVIYQEAPFKNNLNSLVVKNSLLVDTYSKQVNTLNYQGTEIKGSLTFTESEKVATIER